MLNVGEAGVIIAVSIVDMDRQKDMPHLGTYFFEIDYPGTAQVVFSTLAVSVEDEEKMRPYLNRLVASCQCDEEPSP